MHSGVVRTLSKTSSRPSVEEVKDELRRRTLAVGKQDQSIRTDLFGSVKHTAIPARSLRFFRIPVRLSVPTAAPLVTSITSPCNAHPSPWQESISGLRCNVYASWSSAGTSMARTLEFLASTSRPCVGGHTTKCDGQHTYGQGARDIFVGCTNTLHFDDSETKVRVVS